MSQRCVFAHPVAQFALGQVLIVRSAISCGYVFHLEDAPQRAGAANRAAQEAGVGIAVAGWSELSPLGRRTEGPRRQRSVANEEDCRARDAAHARDSGAAGGWPKLAQPQPFHILFRRRE